jgi:2-polyprenyl-3-methyl-5-hydroxy-6-metoxy-1,4-benzoquinol methylase
MDFDEYALDVASKLRTDRREASFDRRVKMLRKALRPVWSRVQAARSILDYGCGAGEFLHFLSTHCDASLTGFDLSRTQLEGARKFLSGRKIALYSGLSEIQDKFDLIFSLHVIEHVPDEQLGEYAGTMARLLSPGGAIVVSTPNGMNPFAYPYFMSTDRTHLRMHSPFTLNEIFRPHGLEVLSIHRELPQAYDLSSTAKTAVWAVYGSFFKLGVYACAGGVRSLRFPLIMAPTFFAVIGKPSDSKMSSRTG